jgi:hypothetical protein
MLYCSSILMCCVYIYSTSLCPVQTGSGAHRAFFPMGTGDLFPEGKVRPGRDADLPPSSAEVVNEYELYLLSPLRLHRCVVGLLYRRLLVTDNGDNFNYTV